MAFSKILRILLFFVVIALLGAYFGIIHKKPDFVPGFVPSFQSIVTQEQTDTPVELEDVPKGNIVDFPVLIKLIKATPGTYSLYIKDLATNVVYEHNSDKFYDTASIFKLFVAVSVMKNIEQKNISLDHYFTITGVDFEQGTGVLQYESLGKKYTVAELLALALKQSDNVAQNILIRAIAKNYVADDTFSKENLSSARKVGVFLENFYENKYITQVSRDYLLNLMQETDFDDRVGLELRDDIRFAHKIGNWPSDASWHDCGLAQKDDKVLAVCVMSKNASYENFLLVAKNTGLFVNSIL